MAERFLCADAARERDDPIAGTAAPARAWILIEHSGRWPIEGFAGLDIDRDVKRHVSSAAQSAGARVLLIRRPGRQAGDGPPRWAVLRHEDGGNRQHWGTFAEDDDLTAIPEALHRPGETGPPVLLVCTHGLHDPCCAARGRPVARALAGRWPALTWACSHLGGDRFAANVLVAPDGVYYGDLDPQSALGVVEDHLAGRIRADHLRGYTDLTPPQQVAVIEVLRRYGPVGRDDLAIVDASRDGDRWRVRLAGRPPLPAHLDVELTVTTAPARRLTCHAARPSTSILYRVASIVAN